MMQQEIYLDNSATTQVDQEVAQLALQMMTEEFGNPSSLHRKGLRAQLALERATRQVARALGAQEGEVFFTSGGTESNNTAVFGAAAARGRQGHTLVTTAVEHASVLGPFEQLEKQGFTVRRVAPGADGSISPEQVAAAVDEDTVLLSVMAVNNELGNIFPLEEIARLARRKSPRLLIHCDAVQAFGKLPVPLARWDVDLLSVSGHKIHAPKGVGALYIRKGVHIRPLLFGGGQQQDLRPGTENLPLICAMGLASQRAWEAARENWEHACRLQQEARRCFGQVDGVVFNSPEAGSPYILNLSVPGFRSEVLLHGLEEQGVYVSSGSACSRGHKSHVLQAAGLPAARVDSALRLSFSRDTTCAQLQAAAQALQQLCKRLHKSR